MTTSNINPANINTAYPVAGQDNNSQGFRTNFTNIAQNFQFAADEITDLQNKVVLKSALTGGSPLNNDMNGQQLSNAQILDFCETGVNLGTMIGTVLVNYASGHFQYGTTGSSVVLGFTGWPPVGLEGWVTVQIAVSSVAHTVTLPNTVSLNTVGVQGLNTSTNVITFAATGTYTFTFTSVNNGATVTLTETNKALQPMNASSENLLTTAAASLAVTTSYVSGAGTATLGAGVSGQVKVFTQTAAGSMVITVTNAGWGGSGHITLASLGAGCTLQYTNGSWWCIGNNGCTFA